MTLAQRFGVWKAWRCVCFWCREPVYFRDCHIDHLLPRASESVLPVLIEQYNLPSDFDIEGYENLVPAHPSCNRRKSDTLLDASPAFALYVVQARQVGVLAKEIAKSVEQDHRKAPLLVKLASAISQGDITESDIQDLLSGLPVLVRKSLDDIPEKRIFIAPGWEIIENNGGRDIGLVRTTGRMSQKAE